MPRLGQRLGQRAGHIGQAAGFDKGNRLRGGKQDLHNKSPFRKHKMSWKPKRRAAARRSGGSTGSDHRLLGDGQRIGQMAHEHPVLIDRDILIRDDVGQGSF